MILDHKLDLWFWIQHLLIIYVVSYLLSSQNTLLKLMCLFLQGQRILALRASGTGECWTEGRYGPTHGEAIDSFHITTLMNRITSYLSYLSEKAHSDLHQPWYTHNLSKRKVKAWIKRRKAPIVRIDAQPNYKSADRVLFGSY